MGLAATQVRLLQLTARQHNIEYQAQRFQAQKLQLANESDAAYSKYMEALDAKKIQYKYVDGNGYISYIDATFNNMFTYDSRPNSNNVQTPYALEILNGDDAGKFYVTDKKYNNHDLNWYYLRISNWEAVGSSQNGLDKLNERFGTEFTLDDRGTDEFIYYQKRYAIEYCAHIAAGGSASFGGTNIDQNTYDYFTKLFALLIESNGVVELDNDYADSTEWLTNMVANGEVLLHKYDASGGDNFTGAWIEDSVSTDTILQEVADEKELKKAEATYEAETKRINRKDAKYDTMLAQTETERNTIKTQMDSLKKVRTENVEQTFKLFS